MQLFIRATGALLLCLSLLGVVAETAHAHGLIAARAPDGPTPEASTQPIRLVSHRVRAKVDGPVAAFEVEQVFRNTTQRRLEGTYLFPLPEGAAVARFAMTLGGRLVEGEVLPADQARAIYESIVRTRRDPGLLEYVGRGLYRARVFPIEPGRDVTIRLAFQQVLPDTDGTLELRYPLATDRLHGQPVEEVVFTADVRADEDVKAVYSPSHDLAVVRKSDREVHASYEGSGRRQTRDLLLYVGRSPERVGLTVLTHRAPGEDGTFLAVLSPSRAPAETKRVSKDVVFVLDTSGSMREDGKIEQAKRALRFGVSALRPEDRFGIVTFAAQVRRFRPGLVFASDAMRSAVGSFISGLSADGGTNLAGGLEDALSLAGRGRLPLVVLISDGKPTVGVRDAAEILKQVERSNEEAEARVFTFGVGFDVDVNLLDRIAESTRGARDYVAPRDELEIATSRFFRKVVEPVMTDLRLDLGEGVHDVYPHPLPDLFAGSQIVVMGRYATGGKREVRIRGQVGDRAVERVYPMSLGDEARAPYLPRLWANRKVAFLLDEIRLHGEEPELVKEATRLATTFGIVTPYTSHLVVEEEELERAGRVASGSGRARPPSRGRTSGGAGGAYRGPGGSVPPGIREPSDPTPPPAPPTSGPPTTPTPNTPAPTMPPPASAGMPAPAAPSPGAKVGASKRLKAEKERDRVRDEPAEGRIRTAGGRTFVRSRDGWWVDTRWEETVGKEGAPEVVKIGLYADAWTKLARLDDRLAKILALGERIRLLWDGKAYEVAPEEDPVR